MQLSNMCVHLYFISVVVRRGDVDALVVGAKATTRHHAVMQYEPSFACWGTPLGEAKAFVNRRNNGCPHLYIMG